MATPEMVCFLSKKKAKAFHKYCPAATGMMFSKKHVRDTKFHSSACYSIAYDTSLFLIVHDINQYGINLNDDWEKLSNWVFQWNMSFNHDINK